MIECHPDLCRLSAVGARQALLAGETTCAELVAAAVARIDQRDHDIGAWAAAVDKTVISRQLPKAAHEAPLGGVLVGVKDIIDTASFPTACGSPIYVDRRPTVNARAVDLLETAGAVIVGKTVTTEFATYQPAKTVNPHNFLHTPGGSSSGSAAAVADCHVAVALGTQTAGSIIRPASFCGAVGFKPTFGRFSYDGVKRIAPSLDTLGLFARCVTDIRLVASVLDPALSSTSAGELQRAKVVRVGFCRTPWWDAASETMHATVHHAATVFAAAGASVSEVALPRPFLSIADAHRKLMAFELSQSLESEWRLNGHLLSDPLKLQLAFGRSLTTAELQEAIRTIRTCRAELGGLFTRHDVLLTPAALGAAPRGLHSTGDPIFCVAWTGVGAPCLTIPAGSGEESLPLGIQLIAAIDADSELIDFASWAECHLRPSVPTRDPI